MLQAQRENEMPIGYKTAENRSVIEMIRCGQAGVRSTVQRENTTNSKTYDNKKLTFASTTIKTGWFPHSRQISVFIAMGSLCFKFHSTLSYFITRVSTFQFPSVAARLRGLLTDDSPNKGHSRTVD